MIKPLAAEAIPLVAWRLRDITQPASRTVLENLPVCANCHSFSADGKTMGMDLDGLHNNRGLYMLAKVAPQLSVGRQDVVQWRTAQGALDGNVRVGFLSAVSPDGQHVVTTINPLQRGGAAPSASSNYYVANFKDYRFLQVFYPTRGILAWYSKATGVLQPLPGADDPRYVQMGAVWSPDGRYLVFARATARDPDRPGIPLARFANDPGELPIRYDLYRIPFRNGGGGVAEPVRGASQNGRSNSFPRVSPDGRWIVFVEARNGLLMRPDSRLFIVPAEGGEARPMRANTRLMNSWHSFSPNGRWLVFSSKSRSPYTQMYLTHIDPDGQDSPPILIDNATAANRAVNLPEFVNIPPDGLEEIGGPAIDYYKRFNSAMFWQKRGQPERAAALWKQVLELAPDDADAHRNLGADLLLLGRREEAGAHMAKAAELPLRAAVAEKGDAAAYAALGRWLAARGRTAEAVENLRRAAALDPSSAAAQVDLGVALLALGKAAEARTRIARAIEIDPRYAPAHYDMGRLLEAGDLAGATVEFRAALALDSRYEEAHDGLARVLYRSGRAAEALAEWRQGTEDADALRQMAWVLATAPDVRIRNGAEAAALAARAIQKSSGSQASVWDTLAAAYAETGRFADALQSAARALDLAEQAHEGALAAAIRLRIGLYRSRQPFHESAARRDPLFQW